MKKDVGGAREGILISDKSRHFPLDLSFWNYFKIFHAEIFFFFSFVILSLATRVVLIRSLVGILLCFIPKLELLNLLYTDWWYIKTISAYIPQKSVLKKPQSNGNESQ